MSLFKGKKKKVYSKKNDIIQTTIDNRHNQKVKFFNSEKLSLVNKRTQLSKMNTQLQEYMTVPLDVLSDKEIILKLELNEQKKNLEEEIKRIESNSKLDDYILETSHLLYEYFDENNTYSSIEPRIKSSAKTKTVLDFFNTHTPTIKKDVSKPSRYISEYSNKNEIMDKYLSIMDENYVRNVNNIQNEDLDNCTTCNIARISDTTHGCMICPKCGCEEKILVDCDTPSYKEPPRELTYFAYKKINHANEWLSQFQAKESTDIDEDIFDKIVNELKKESYINLSTLTVDKVRDILKKLDLTKYYEHCHYITNRITGKPAPIITSELEDKIRNMFKEIQSPWMKYCPSDRSNFFSYPYIFYKFFQLLDKDEYLPYCRLLKSREKLQEHDEVWKKICSDLRWQYIATV